MNWLRRRLVSLRTQLESRVRLLFTFEKNLRFSTTSRRQEELSPAENFTRTSRIFTNSYIYKVAFNIFLYIYRLRRNTMNFWTSLWPTSQFTSTIPIFQIIFSTILCSWLFSRPEDCLSKVMVRLVFSEICFMDCIDRKYWTLFC